MTSWTPAETAAILRGETVTRWVEWEEQPPEGWALCGVSTVKEYLNPNPYDRALFVPPNRDGRGWVTHAPHRPGDRVSVYLPCPGCNEAGDHIAHHGDDYVICTAVEAERRGPSRCKCGMAIDDGGNHLIEWTPGDLDRWGWLEEWRRDDE